MFSSMGGVVDVSDAGDSGSTVVIAIVDVFSGRSDSCEISASPLTYLPIYCKVQFSSIIPVNRSMA